MKNPGPGIAWAVFHPHGSCLSDDVWTLRRPGLQSGEARVRTRTNPPDQEPRPVKNTKKKASQDVPAVLVTHVIFRIGVVLAVNVGIYGIHGVSGLYVTQTYHGNADHPTWTIMDYSLLHLFKRFRVHMHKTAIYSGPSNR